jgi:hypothetical protein
MTTPYRPLIRTQADLEDVWRHLMKPLGFDRAGLWLLLIDADDRPLPQLTEVSEIPDLPDPETTSGLAHVLTEVMHGVDPDGRWAFLRSRPGRGGVDETDRAWAAGLYEMCREAGIAHDVVHLATDADVIPIPLDDVTGYVRAS